MAYATAVIAKPTVPLPFNNVDIANPSMLENLEIFVPKNPPIVLPNMPNIINKIRNGMKFSKDCALNFIPIIAKNSGAIKPKVIPDIVP